MDSALTVILDRTVWVGLFPKEIIDSVQAWVAAIVNGKSRENMSVQGTFRVECLDERVPNPRDRFFSEVVKTILAK